MIFLQGRVTASNLLDEAKAKIRDNLRQGGYVAAKISCYPCPIQPWKGTVWWEYQVEVREVMTDLEQINFCLEETEKHRKTVAELLDAVKIELSKRQRSHDISKTQPPELEIFVIYTPLLKETTYGSPEYKQYLQSMQNGLAHHYEKNSHHPEHYENGIRDMDLVDLIEMFCDWKAATLRHADGDICRSIEINKERFGYSEELAAIFRNTLKYF